jgi:signal transduction histidine kinase
VGRNISDRKRAERERSFLTQRLITVGEEQRKRLARDIHDELGQTLTALRFVLDALDLSLNGSLEVQKQRCREALSLVEQTSNSVRTILFELRPSVLDDLGLVPALQSYIARFTGYRPKIKIKFSPLGIKRRLRRENEDVLFRVFQECLNNVVKHSSAENVEVSLTYSHPKIILIIKDDGTGFDPVDRVSRFGHSGQGIGLLGMRERVDSVGGKFEVTSKRWVGTIVRVELEDSKRGKR